MEPKKKQFRLSGLQKRVRDIPDLLSRKNDSLLSKISGPGEKKNVADRAFERNMAEMDVFNNAERSIKDMDKEYKKMSKEDKEYGVAVARGGAVARARAGNLPSLIGKEDLDNK